MLKKIGFISLLLATFFVSASHATIISLDDVDGASLTWTQEGLPEASFAGELVISSDDPYIAPYGYCIQQDTNIWVGYDYYTIEPMSDVTGIHQNVAWLIHTFRTNDQFEKAALQLAIWDVLVNDDGEIDDITDIVPPEVATYFATIKTGYETDLDLSDIAGEGYKLAQLRYSDLTDAQDMVVRVVPEPTSMLLFGFGLLGLGAIGRRKA